MEKQPSLDEDSIIEIGGNVDKALAGQYLINPKAVITEAWQKTTASRLSINIGLLFVLILGMMASLLFSQYLGGIEQVLQSPEASLILNLIVTVVIWPFLAGVEMMGVLHAVGLKTQPKLVFSFLRRGSWVALCAVMTSMFISLGLQLLIFPGIFLAVVLSLSIPLVVEKRLSPAKAIVLSVKALRFQWFNIFVTYLMLVGALVVAMLPMYLLRSSDLFVLGAVAFLVSLSYIAPCYYNVKGVLYREIFGMKLQTMNSGDQGSNDTFIA